MRLTTVAEGVEQPEQAAWLQLARCSLGQGYLWSRPVELAAAREPAAVATATPASPPPCTGAGDGLLVDPLTGEACAQSPRSAGRSASSTAASSIVDGTAASLPSAISRIVLRRILPLRVFGRPADDRDVP